ncbi:MAG: NADH dehydrogenase-like protein [candidate division WS6 bacterium OLB20]|uniref:NADH dehydrogenase-like protein n=1 Tax=candidate division WS6 bacterium OLB20 TaxID=1617426 RepID=A0A136LX64_9BACT|nr:MAG: NADH dehydrogenase-like protein [candidate division WS6 bacterium OLB20]
MLHEAATLGVTDTHLAEPVESLLRKTDRFIEAEVTEVDPDSKTVTAGGRQIGFDYLLIAAGSRTSYAGVPGAREFSFPLKTYEDVVRLRSRIIGSFRAGRSQSIQGSLSFVVVGGGGTGVEMAAELAELIQSTLRRHYGNSVTDQARITLVHRGLELVPDFEPGLRARTAEILRHKGITLITGKSVREVTPRGVLLHDSRFIAARTTIWTAGVEPVNVGLPSELLDDRGFVVTDENQSLPLYPDIFAAGDIASRRRGRQLPLRAQVASKQGSAFGQILYAWHTGREQVPFEYQSSGELVSIGQWYAVGSIRGQTVAGSLAWYIRRTVYLLKMISFWKKLKVSLDWTVRLFYHRELLPEE